MNPPGPRTASFLSSRLVLSALLLGVVAVWGATFIMVKDAIPRFGVVPFLAVRFLIGSAVLAPFTLRRWTRGGLTSGGLVGLALAAGFLLQTLGLDLTTATSSGLITGLFVVFAPLANRALFGVRTPGKLWVGIAAAVAGLYLLTYGGPAVPPTPALAAGAPSSPPGGLTGRTLGDFLTVLCAACFGLHVALLDRVTKRHEPLALAQGQLVMAAAVYLAAWPFIRPLGWPPAEVWPALLITGVLATAAAYIIQTLAQRRLSAVEAAMIMFLEPLFAAIFGYIGGDRLTLVQMAGGAIMLAAFAGVEIYPRWTERRRNSQNGR